MRPAVSTTADNHPGRNRTAHHPNADPSRPVACPPAAPPATGLFRSFLLRPFLFRSFLFRLILAWLHARTPAPCTTRKRRRMPRGIEPKQAGSCIRLHVGMLLLARNPWPVFSLPLLHHELRLRLRGTVTDLEF